MKKKIVIFGTGGHAITITNELKKLKRFSIYGYCVHNTYSLGAKKFLSSKIFNINKDNLQMMSRLSISGVIAIGDNNVRKKIVDEVKLLSNNFKWEKIISKDSFVGENVEVDDGAVIMSGCIIGPFTKIKRHCLVNTGSIIEHENQLDEYSSTGPGAVTAGNVKIGELSHLGIGAVVKERIKIGKNVIIGGNSFVNKNCINNSVYFGSPAKLVKKIKIIM
jgi:sugar O-acyltransferase (sialic acid O-acetyltransferase NeuD family)